MGTNSIQTENLEKKKEDIEKLKYSIEKFILSKEEEIMQYFYENYNESTKVNLFQFNTNREGLENLIKLENYGKIEHSIVMKYDADEHIKEDKELYELCNIEIYNIGGLLSENGLIHRMLSFYTFFFKILNRNQEASREKIFDEIDRALGAIKNDDINFFQTFYKIKLTKNFLYLLKSGYYKIISMFKAPLGETIFSFLKGIGNKALATLVRISLSIPGLISFPCFIIIGIFSLVSYYFIKNKKEQINMYIKKKNIVNLSIIFNIINQIFTNEEEEYKDFFEKNNIYILAYDANIIWYKNAGAIFFGKDFPSNPKQNEDDYKIKKDDDGKQYPKKLIENDIYGFNTYYTEEKLIYETYSKSIEEIRNFFKNNKERFQRLKDIKDKDYLNDENYVDIKEIICNLIKLNEKNADKKSDFSIVSDTNSEFNNNLEQIPKNYAEEIKEKIGEKIQYQNSQEENTNLKKENEVQRNELEETLKKIKEKEEENKKMAEEIKVLKDKLEEEKEKSNKQKQIAEENKQLKEKIEEDNLKELEKLKEEKLALAKMKNEYNQKNEQNKSKENQLKKEENDLELKKQEIHEKERQNIIKEKQLKEKEIQLEEREDTNKNESLLLEKEFKLELKKLENDDIEEQNKMKEKQLNEREIQLKEREDQLKEREDKLEEKEKIVEDTKGKVITVIENLKKRKNYISNSISSSSTSSTRNIQNDNNRSMDKGFVKISNPL